MKKVMKAVSSIMLICVFSFQPVFAETPFSVKESQIPELKKEGRYFLIALYYYYAAVVSRDHDMQLDNIQKAIAVLPENADPEGNALIGMLNVYRSQFYTGNTRTYYLSLGILLLNKNVQKQPENLRLRFMRMLSFSHLPLKFYNVKKHLNEDRKVFHTSIEKEGLQNVDKVLGYLYYNHWEILLRDDNHE